MGMGQRGETEKKQGRPVVTSSVAPLDLRLKFEFALVSSAMAAHPATSLAFLLLATQPFGVHADGPTTSRPALVRRSTHLHSSRLGRAELTAATERSEADAAWHSRVLKWGDTHASAAWYPCLLGFIGFMDPFTLCGFLVTPLLTLVR